MTPTRADAQALVDKLERTLQECERQTGLQRIELTVKGLSPDGPQVGHDISLDPSPISERLQWAIEEIRRILVEFERDTDLWVDHVGTQWTREEPPRRLLDCTFRAAYQA